MSFNKKVSFPNDLKGFSVRSVSSPPVPIEKVAEESGQKFEEGKKSATEFYLAEINKLRNEFAANQQSVLENLNQKTDHTLDQLNENLDHLDEKESVKFESDYSITGETPDNIMSSGARELAYCIEHSIHHQALIKAALITLGCW